MLLKPIDRGQLCQHTRKPRSSDFNARPPKSPCSPEQLRSRSIATTLTLAPEELGEHALRSATQSGWPSEDTDAHTLGAAPALAVPRYSDTFEPSDEDMWTETIQLAEEYGAWVDGRSGDSALDWDDEPAQPIWARDLDSSQDKATRASSTAKRSRRLRSVR